MKWFRLGGRIKMDSIEHVSDNNGSSKWFDINVLRYAVPNSANSFGYVLGSLLLFSFLVMGITGALLGLFYTPNPQLANQSVTEITNNVFMRYIRGVHIWTAEIIPVLIFLHIIRITLTGSYKGKRQINWFLGIILLLTTFTLIFTGSVLKWDQAGFEALAHFEEIGKIFAPLGGILFTSELTVTAPLLSRIYLFHVSILPMVLILLIGAHVTVIKLVGISSLPKEEKIWRQESQISFLDHIKAVTLYSISFFVAISVLSLFFPAVSRPAPIVGTEVSRPDWIFLPWYPLENIWGVMAIVIFPSIITFLLFIIPLIDREENRNPRKGRQRIAVAIVLFIPLMILVLNILSGVLKPAQHL